jgi:hypothetical protein
MAFLRGGVSMPKAPIMAWLFTMLVLTVNIDSVYALNDFKGVIHHTLCAPIEEMNDNLGKIDDKDGFVYAEPWLDTKSATTLHSGLDINTKNNECTNGTPSKVFSIASGKVVYSGNANGSFQGIVMIEHELEHKSKKYSYTSQYAHIIPMIVKGEKVDSGDLIGYIAKGTGSNCDFSSIPNASNYDVKWDSHLHFEIRWKKNLDAYYWPSFDNLQELKNAPDNEKINAVNDLGYIDPALFLQDPNILADYVNNTGGNSNSTPIEKDCNFSDISDKAHHKQAVKKLCELGIISSANSSSEHKNFRGEDKIIRAEFTKIVVGAKDSNTRGKFECDKVLDVPPFSDVNKNNWFCNSIFYAEKKGIVGGYPKGKTCENEKASSDDIRNFCPFNKINKADAAKIIAKAFFPKESESKNENVACCSIYSDISEKTAWYCPFVNVLTDKNILQKVFPVGKDFNPGTLLTRGEMARLIHLTIKN